MSHTPGTWDRNIPPAKKYPVIYAGRNTHICTLTTTGLTDAEIEGNADLIKAAPELLDALRDANQLLETLWQGSYAGRPLAIKIQRAIDRAEGLGTVPALRCFPEGAPNDPL